MQESKVLHRFCGQRGAYDSKRANKNPLLNYKKIYLLFEFSDINWSQNSI